MKKPIAIAGPWRLGTTLLYSSSLRRAMMSIGSDMLMRVLASSWPKTRRICSNRATTSCPLISSASVTTEK